MTDQDQEFIFTYHDGTRQRAADVFRIQLKLLQCDYDFEIALRRIKGEFSLLDEKTDEEVAAMTDDQQATYRKTVNEQSLKIHEAAVQTAEVLCGIFDLKMIHDTEDGYAGLPVHKILEIYYRWREFTDDLGKDGGSQSTLQPSTESTAARNEERQSDESLNSPSGSARNGLHTGEGITRRPESPRPLPVS